MVSVHFLTNDTHDSCYSFGPLPSPTTLTSLALVLFHHLLACSVVPWSMHIFLYVSQCLRLGDGTTQSLFAGFHRSTSIYDYLYQHYIINIFKVPRKVLYSVRRMQPCDQNGTSLWGHGAWLAMSGLWTRPFLIGTWRRYTPPPPSFQ